MLHPWTIKKDPHRQRHQIQEQTMDRSIRKIKDGTEIHTYLFTAVQRQN